jgi:hypothetical protein
LPKQQYKEKHIKGKPRFHTTLSKYIRPETIYHHRLEEEVNRWTPFRKTLLHDEREVFDRLVDQAFR